MRYWECLTHECGSTRFNNLTRHVWDVCVIRKREGKPDKRTWHNPEIGGLNGDVSRKFYKDWEELCLNKQQASQRRENWRHQLELHEKKVERNDYTRRI